MRAYEDHVCAHVRWDLKSMKTHVLDLKRMLIWVNQSRANQSNNHTLHPRVLTSLPGTVRSIHCNHNGDEEEEDDDDYDDVDDGEDCIHHLLAFIKGFCPREMSPSPNQNAFGTLLLL